jgi:uncharacterized protein involved in exopolysaccharide biosynthesis
MMEMDDEIDLRRYVLALLRGWKLIVALAAAGALAAGLLGLLRAREYEATALVAVARLPYALQLTGVNQAVALPAQGYRDLAQSDEVVAQVAGAVGQLPGSLRRGLSAAAGSDPALLRLTVTNGDPERAAEIANAWAQVLVAHVARLYGPEAPQLAAYAAQLAEAETRLLEAERVLTAFQAQTPAALLTAELAARQASMTGYLSRERRFALLARDAQDLLARLETLSAQAPAAAADEAALLLLTAQAVVNAPDAGGAAIQVQVGGAPASGQTSGQLAAAVRAFVGSVQAQGAEAQAAAEAEHPRILALQAELAEVTAAGRELERARTLAETRYLALAAQVEEATLAADEAASTVTVASRASLSNGSARVGTSRIVLVGALAGAAIGAGLVLLREWLGPRGQPSVMRPAQAGPADGDSHS